MHIERALNALAEPRPEHKKHALKRQNRFGLFEAFIRDQRLRRQSRQKGKNSLRGGIFFMLLSRSTPLQPPDRSFMERS